MEYGYYAVKNRVFRLLSITQTSIKASLDGALNSVFTVTELCCVKGRNELKVILEEKKPQVLILDLDLMDGLEALSGMVRPGILWAGITEDCTKGFFAYKLGFFEVLKKPFNPIESNGLLERMLRKLLAGERPLTISCPKEARYLTTNSILYIQADNNYVTMHLQDGDRFTVFNTLSHFEETLYFPFFRVHKSYIVNSNHIRRIHFTKRFLRLTGCELFIPYSGTYAETIAKIDRWKRRPIHF